MSLVVLGANDVEGVISKMPVDDLSNLMATVFRRYSLKSQIAMPHRTVIENRTINTLFMPSSMANLAMSIKTVSVPKTGMSGSTNASTLLIDETTGAAKALINAGCLTAYRTAAGKCLKIPFVRQIINSKSITGSVLATSLLRGDDFHPNVLVTFGAGAQIEAHLILLLQKFSSVRNCIIVNRSTNSRLKDLHQKMQAEFPNVGFRTRCLEENPSALEEIVKSADIICTATPSRKPLFPAEWVKNGAHINLVGSYTPEMMEVEESLLDRCNKIVVDSRDACAVEAGELIRAHISREDMIEVGELVDAKRQGNSALATEARAKDITIFKSVGIGLQDTAIAKEIYDRAMQIGIGVRVDTFN